MKYCRVALAGCLILLPALAISGDPDPKQSATVESATNSRDTDLRTLLREMGSRTHRHFVLDPRTPPRIELGGLDHQDVTYPQLLAILQVNGMAVVADEGIMKVIPNADVRQEALPPVAPGNIKTLDDEWVTCVIPVKNISAAQLVPIMRPMLPQSAHMAALPDRNTLIVVDRSANVRRIVDIIRILEGRNTA